MKKKKPLEQYDYCDDTHINKSFDEYSKAIGSFIIKFSELEHELNQAIADTFFDDDQSVGYRVIKGLAFSKKIQLFHEIFLELAFFTAEGEKGRIKDLNIKLKEINSFRNKIVHANWLTLTEDGHVRTTIDTNTNDGTIEFISVKILPSTINEFIEKIEDIIAEIDKGLDHK